MTGSIVEQCISMRPCIHEFNLQSSHTSDAEMKQTLVEVSSSITVQA
jgi:hypothetical protein